MVYDYEKPTLTPRVPKEFQVTLLPSVVHDQSATKAEEVADALSSILNAKIDGAFLGAPNQSVTILQGIHLALTKKALTGNLAAAKLLLEWYAYGVQRPETATDTPNQNNTQVNIYNELDPATKRMLQSIGVELPQ